MKDRKNCNCFDKGVNRSFGLNGARALIAETLIAVALDGGDCEAALVAAESGTPRCQQMQLPLNLSALVRVSPRPICSWPLQLPL